MKSYLRFSLFLVMVLPLASCDSMQIAKAMTVHMLDGVSGKREVASHYKVGKPYRVGGKWYYPKEDTDYREEGMASWYGKDFQGKPTANGEIFDRHIVSAAHRTLPLPSMVKVTNLKNGKSMMVRVNDRGPYAHNRIIDLSEEAAKKLGFHKQGIVKVRVEFDRAATANMFERTDHKHFSRSGKTRGKSKVGAMKLASSEAKTVAFPVAMASPTAATQEWRNKQQPHITPGLNLYIQTGAYSSQDSARKVAQTFVKLTKTRIQEVAFPERTLYRVRLGPLNNEQEADALLNTIEGMGFHDAIIVED